MCDEIEKPKSYRHSKDELKEKNLGIYLKKHLILNSPSLIN